jgi:hypothetical protein
VSGRLTTLFGFNERDIFSINCIIMKKTLFAIVSATSVFTSGANALTLQPGESFEYSFQAQSLTRSANNPGYYESDVTWDISPGKGSNLFHFEMFENTDFSGSVQSFDAFIESGGVVIAEPDYSNIKVWRDADGAVRFSAINDSMEINSVKLLIKTPTDTYTLNITPQAVPEVSSLALFTLGMSFLMLIFRCRND